jgi:prepilin signal peptidase PulO-like enzyme (type II secretory pathway)
LQYPLVEFATGILFVYIYLFLKQISTISPFNLFLIYYLFIVSGLLVIFITDLKYRIIPDEVLLVLIVITAGIKFYQFPNLIFLNCLSSGLLFFSLFLFLFLVTRGKGMGFGDVKYAFLMGLVLGFPNIIVGFYLAFLTGAFISLILLLIGKKRMKSKIAFGPFLTLSTFVTLFYGDELWVIFKKILGI